MIPLCLSPIIGTEHSRPESHEFWNLVNIGTKGQQNEGTGQRQDLTDKLGEA